MNNETILNNEVEVTNEVGEALAENFETQSVDTTTSDWGKTAILGGIAVAGVATLAYFLYKKVIKPKFTPNDVDENMDDVDYEVSVDGEPIDSDISKK